PVLLTCRPGIRLSAALCAGVAAAAFIAPMALANSSKFETNTRAVQGGWGHASRLSVRWPVGSPLRVETGDGHSFTVRNLPGHATTYARPAVALLAAALSLAFAFRRRRRVPDDTLELLALFLLLRCMLDPLDNDYYHAPSLLCLATWE